MDFTDHNLFSRSLGWGGDWSLEVQLTLFQPVGGEEGGRLCPLHYCLYEIFFLSHWAGVETGIWEFS